MTITFPFKLRAFAISWPGKLLFGALVLFQLGQFLDLDDRLQKAYANWSISDAVKQNSIWLNDYQVDIEASPLPEIDDNLSGITWSGATRTLFSVTNGSNLILELSSEGKVLRSIQLEGFRDVEGITWVGGQSFLVIDERFQSLHQIVITKDTQTISVEQSPQITLGIESGNNKGFEGIAWSAKEKAAYVVKERDPMTTYKISGFSEQGLTSKIMIDEMEELNRKVTRNKSDLSGLHLDPKTGHLLVLSDESHHLTEISPKGEIISHLELDSRFQNLQNRVPQAEGITMDDLGNLYVVSEPNLFYRFVK